MEFTLTRYQAQAVADVLPNLTKARDLLEHGLPSSFGLTAATGAGKTVIAASVMEALFFGDEENRFEADENAVVLWFSQDPVLNRQTKHRIAEASDLISSTRLEIIETSFVRERLEPGKVYFINTQKFSVTSSLTRGHHAIDDTEDALPMLGRRTLPDSRRYTIWDTIRNTIEDPNLNLYLFVDEAHRGMGAPKKADRDENQTILRRLINGHADVPPAPVVFGISATIDRFKKVMEGSEGRTPLKNVEVDRQEVLASGLVKDDVVLTGVDESGRHETVLLRQGVQRLREMSEAWARYTGAEKEKRVLPLMVLQVPNKPTEAALAGWVDTVMDEWPDLQPANFAHVFGEQTPLTFDDMVVPYVSPEDVQDTEKVRVLLAKDAISTGWDCPRAEVMVSFRAVKEPVTVTQLLGRLVRSPLRRRIDGHGLLNTVFCALPNFDESTVEKVVQLITQGVEGEDPLPVGRVLTDAKVMSRNPVLGEKLGADRMDQVMEALAAVPSEHAPARAQRPIARFLALAKEMSADELVLDGVKKSHALLNKEIAALSIRFDETIEAAVNDIEQVDLVEVTARMGADEDELVTRRTQVAADDKSLRDAFAVARRNLGTTTADSHVTYLLSQASDFEDQTELLRDARLRVAAVGRQRDLVGELEGAADKLTALWLDEHAAEIPMLSSAREKVYTDIKVQSREIQTSTIGEVLSSTEPTMVEQGSKKVPIETFGQHVLADDHGQFPWEPNKAERFVLQKEQGRNSFLAWYRNPSRGSKEALRVCYERDERWRSMHPDFIFFFDKAGEVVPAIIDPHGSQLSDAMPKLVGLARFAEEHADVFPRIEAVTDWEGGYVYLDLRDQSTRDAIRHTDDPKVIFGSKHAKEYQ